MNLEEIKFGFTVLTALLAAFNWVYVWLSNRNRVTNERISSMESHVDKRLDNHAERLARLEQKVESGPSHADIKRLHARIDEMAAGFARMTGEFHTSQHTLNLIHDYLLHGGKK